MEGQGNGGGGGCRAEPSVDQEELTRGSGGEGQCGDH